MGARFGSVALCGWLAVWSGCAADAEGEGRARGGSTVADPFGNSNGSPGDFGNPGSVAGAPPSAGPPSAFVPETSVPFHRDDTAMSGLDAATLDALRQGGAACANPMLYPYEGTVFPGGLISPPVMWASAAEAAYVRVQYDAFDTVQYEFAVGPSDPGELRMPQDAWSEITRRTQNTPLRITLSVLAGGTVTSCETSWHIAPGNMTGTIYYNTYSAPGAITLGSGAVMRLPLGKPTADIYLQYPGFAVTGTGPCTSCHSVSANGSTMAASTHDYSAKAFDVWSYPVSDVAQPQAKTEQVNGVFGALTPDGSRMLAMGNPDCTAGSETFPRSANNIPLVEGPAVARLLETATGADTHAAGLDPTFYMWMPQFSPDGTKVVFNHAKPDAVGGTDRRELAVMDYDPASNVFSNLRVITGGLGPAPSLPYSPAPAGAGPVPTGADGCMDAAATASPYPGVPAGTPIAWGGDVGAMNPGTCADPCYPAWPFFTPDGKGVVFGLINEPDFTSAFPGRDVPAQSELWYVDLETSDTVRLDTANRGLDPTDSIFNYYPTVLPVQVGGYFWVFWTSKRAFGNRVIDPLAGLLSGGLSTSSFEAVRKRIWVSAIRPGADGEFVAGPLVDPSAPGFYLEGQSESGNLRAFATLNPCVASGTACTSGLDCCTGFCDIAPGAASGTCTEDVPECAQTNERCGTDDDCCPPASPDEPANSCIGGYCGFIHVE